MLRPSKRKVTITSKPSDADLKLYDERENKQIASGKTPHTATLNRGAGFFKYGKYKAVFEKEGYTRKEVVIEGSSGGWYILGNIVFGGLIGWLIVDPATGAMWTLDPEACNCELEPIKKAEGDLSLKISLVEMVPDQLKGKMKPINIR